MKSIRGKMTVKLIDDFLDVWGALAPLIVRKGLMSLTTRQRTRLVAIKKAARAALDNPVWDPEAWMALSREEFDLLVTAADNRKLGKIYRNLSDEMDRIIHSISHHSDDIRGVFAGAEIDRVALDETDPRAADERITRFLSFTRDRILKIAIEKGVAASDPEAAAPPPRSRTRAGANQVGASFRASRSPRSAET